MQPRGKSLAEHIVSLNGHVRKIESTADLVKVSRTKFVPGDNKENPYNKKLTDFGDQLKAEAKTLGLDQPSIESKLTEISNQTRDCLTNNPLITDAPKKEKDVNAAFNALASELKRGIEEKKADAQQLENNEVLKAQIKKLEENQKQFNEEMARVNERAITHLQALKGLQQLAEFSPQALYRGQILFRARGDGPLDSELDPNMAVIQPGSPDFLLKEMERLQKSGNEYYVGQYGKYKDKIFEYTKDGCRPKPPVKDDDYIMMYSGAMELIREKNPNCDIVVSVPKVKAGASDKDLKFLDAKYIEKKLIPLLEEAHRRGMPVSLDPDLKKYLDSKKLEFEHARSIGKITGKSNFEVQIDKLFALETSPENAKRMQERAQNISDKAPEMQKELKAELSKLEIKPEYKNVGADYQRILGSMETEAKWEYKSSPMVMSGMRIMNDMRDAVLGIDFFVKMQGIQDAKKSDDDKTAIRDVIATSLNNKLNEIKVEVKNVNEVYIKTQKQLEFLTDQIKSDPSVVHRNPFLIEHADRLEKLLDQQQKKLAELEGRAQLILQAAKDAQVKDPDPAKHEKLGEAVKDARTQILAIGEAKTHASGLSDDIEAYKTSRAYEIKLAEAQDPGEQKSFKR